MRAPLRVPFAWIINEVMTDCCVARYPHLHFSFSSFPKLHLLLSTNSFSSCHLLSTNSPIPWPGALGFGVWTVWEFLSLLRGAAIQVCRAGTCSSWVVWAVSYEWSLLFCTFITFQDLWTCTLWDLLFGTKWPHNHKLPAPKACRAVVQLGIRLGGSAGRMCSVFGIATWMDCYAAAVAANVPNDN